MKTEHEFYSIDEFAKLLRVHPNTIRKAIRDGRINAFRISSAKRKPAFRISRSEISRIAEEDYETMLDKIIEKRMKERGII